MQPERLLTLHASFIKVAFTEITFIYEKLAVEALRSGAMQSDYQEILAHLAKTKEALRLIEELVQ